MNVTVPRHDSAAQIGPGALQTLEEELAGTIRDFPEAPHMLGSAFNDALLIMRARIFLDPLAVEQPTWTAVVRAMQIGSAMFETTAVSSGTVECRIDGETLALPATGPRHFTSAGNWLTAFWLAIVCREADRMTKLCRFPVDLLRTGDAVADEYAYAWVDTLQTYWLERPGLVDNLIRTIELSTPEVATIAPRDLLQQILYQPINMFYNFIRRNYDGFNEALVDALEHHKAYWTADESRANDVNGSFALGPLAIACLAYDADFTLTVESDYLPQYLLNRSWTGQYPQDIGARL